MRLHWTEQIENTSLTAESYWTEKVENISITAESSFEQCWSTTQKDGLPELVIITISSNTQFIKNSINVSPIY